MSISIKTTDINNNACEFQMNDHNAENLIRSLIHSGHTLIIKEIPYRESVWLQKNNDMNCLENYAVEPSRPMPDPIPTCEPECR